MGEGAEAHAARAHLIAQARACERLGSPFTAGLCRALAAVLDLSTETGRRVLAWPGDMTRDAVALRLCAGLHALVLEEKDRVLRAAFPPRSASEFVLRGVLPATLRDHDEKLLAFLSHPPQTNEVGRSGILLPGFLHLARETDLPLHLHEIGASAGLNLLFDRFRYRYGEAGWGEEDAPVVLSPELRGAPVPLKGRLKILSRAGSDLAPLDLRRPEMRTRLSAYVWADQSERLARLDAAIKLAGAARVREADALSAVEAMLAAREAGAVTVLVHSLDWQYLPEAARLAIIEAMRAAGAASDARRPLAWLRMEPGASGDAALALTLWPGGNTRHLADADFHGRWIAWR